jgi:4-amino-4-deoxy-L-arabinose transferase-like glycosyltransferase
MELHPLQRRHFRIAVAIAIIAVIIQILYTARNPTNITSNDYARWYRFGHQIVAGEEFQPDSAFWPPGYGIFLGVIFSVFGDNLNTVLIFQIGLGVLSVVLLYLCGVRLIGDVGGAASALLLAINPHYLLYNIQILSENLYLASYVFLLASLLLPKDESKIRWYLVGMLLGIFGLARREGLILGGAVITVVFLFRIGFKWRRIIRSAFVVGFVCALLLVPWVVRNWGVLGAPVFSTTMGANLIEGNNPNADGRWRPEGVPEEWHQQLAGLDEITWDKEATELAVNWIKENPVQFLKLIPQKFIATWEPWPDSRPSIVLDMMLGLLCAIALYHMLRAKQGNWLLLILLAVIPVLYITATSVVFHGLIRFRFITYPGISLLAAYSIAMVIVPYINRYLPLHLTITEVSQNNNNLESEGHNQ